jgi:hypothetical protein
MSVLGVPMFRLCPRPESGAKGRVGLADSKQDRLLRALDPSRKPSSNLLGDLVNWPTNALSSDTHSFAFSPPKSSGILGGLFDPPPQVIPTNALVPKSSGIFGGLQDHAPQAIPTNALVPKSSGIFGGLFDPPPQVIPASPTHLPTTFFGSVSKTPVAIPDVKRKVYFAFSFADVLRVNNLRQIGKVGPRESRNARTFYDRSIWERRRITNDEGLKNLMRNGVQYSSAVCVLVGTDTWDSRWVKYEIARAVIDGRGLFAVHINSLDHHVRRVPDPLGYNPLHLMGVSRHLNGEFHLWENSVVIKNIETGELGWEWQPYEDYTVAISLPRYIAGVGVQHVMPLSWVTRQYDFIVDAGTKNLGAWIDAAAVSVGR